MKPIDRIERIIKYLGGNVSAFEKSIGASNNSIGIAIRRKSNVKDETLRIVLLLALFVSCNKEDNNCECINKVTETASYYIQGCNPEFIESIKAAEKSDRIWKQFEHDYPCE